MDTDCNVGNPTWILVGENPTKKNKSHECNQALEQVALRDGQT